MSCDYTELVSARKTSYNGHYSEECKFFALIFQSLRRVVASGGCRQMQCCHIELQHN